MDSFLASIAKELIEAHGDELRKATVVVPGNRAAAFLKRELSKQLGKAYIAPRIMVMPAFLQWMYGYQQASNLEQLFMLYAAYLAITNEPDSFEQFSKWGSTALRDIADVEQSLVDHKVFFQDLRNIRDIENWSFNQVPLSESQERYLRFWNELARLFTSFREVQSKYEKYSYARIARMALENLRDAKEWSGADKIWIVGLSGFSRAEEAIIDHLMKSGLAACRWDADVYYVNNPLHEAGAFFRERKQKERIEFQDLLATTSKSIYINECSTSFGEVLALTEQLTALSKEDAEQSVVVLADDRLLHPLIERLPAMNAAVNVAMGYALKYTPIYRLSHHLIRMYSRIERTGDHTLYHVDLLNILFDPALSSIVHREPHGIERRINDRFMFRLSPDEIKEISEEYSGVKQLLFLFDRFDLDSKDVLERILKLCQLIEPTVQEDQLSALSIQRLMQMMREMEKHIQLLPYFKNIAALEALFGNMVSKENVAFEGEPLHGLQILNMVETRALDFKHVFVLGCNEDVFPGRGNEQSLIPFDLRLFYGLPHNADREATYAYTFYRLLQRAENIQLFYAAISSDFKGTEPSRYIPQIEIEWTRTNPSIQLSKKYLTLREDKVDGRPDFAENNEFVRGQLDKLFANGISPSALNKFITCPLDFYYRYVIGLPEPDEAEEEMGVATLGSIVHAVLEGFFKPYLHSFPSDEDFEQAKKSIDELLEKAVSEHYSLKYMKVGANFISTTIARGMILKLLNAEQVMAKDSRERDIEPRIEAIEEKMEITLPAERYGRHQSIVLKGIVDRIDSYAGQIEIIDYKTGKYADKDVMWKKNKALFDADNAKMIQLLAYVYMYTKSGHAVENVRSALWSLKNMSNGKLYLNSDGNTAMTADDMLLFEQSVMQTIDSIYALERFEHNPESKYCPYCQSR